MTDTAKKMDYSSLSSSLQNKMHMQRVSNKEKVLLFEKELEDSLKKMDMIELEMIQISKQRKEWLDNISSTYIVGKTVKSHLFLSLCLTFPSHRFWYLP